MKILIVGMPGDKVPNTLIETLKKAKLPLVVINKPVDIPKEYLENLKEFDSLPEPLQGE